MYNDMNLIVDNKDIKVTLLTKVLIGIFFILIIFSFVYKIKTYNNYILQIIEKDGEFYVHGFIQIVTSQFVYNDTFLIDNKEYNYEIINIENDYYEDNNGRYMIVNIKTNLDSKYLINNNFINVKQYNTNDSVFNVMLKRIKKGMNLWKN